MTTGATKIRLLLADDHAVVLEGLVAMIGRQSDMSVVAEASNGPDAVAKWQTHRPDVALIDLRMPALDGVGVISEIRRTDSAARVIILSTYDTEEDVYQAIRAGARGYLLKDARRGEVLTLVAKGRSNREIGSEIHIEESTVKTHLKSIFAKLHAESRTEAVTVATRRGFLRQSGSS